MGSFLMGLACLWIGLFVFYTADGAYNEHLRATGEEDALLTAFVVVGFLWAVAGTLGFWLIGPVWRASKRRRLRR